MIQKRAIAAGLSLLLAGALSACGGEDSAKSGEHEGTDPSLTTLVRSTFSMDYDAFRTPAELAKSADVAVAGTVASVEDGSAIDYDGQEYEHHVRIGVAPTDVITGEKAKVVYFDIPRPTNVSVEPYQKALPVGTEVALVGYKLVAKPVDVKGPAPAYVPAPQGFFINDKAEGFVSVFDGTEDMGAAWSGLDSVEEFVDAMKS